MRVVNSFFIIKGYLQTMAENACSQNQIYQQCQPRLPLTYFDLVEKAGSHGKYQKILLLIFVLMWYVTGSILLGTAFIFRNPSFDCLGLGLLTDNCYDYVCALSPNQWQDFVSGDSVRFKSLANAFDERFYCGDEIYLNIYSALPYLGALVGFIIVSFYADNKGRRKSTIIGWSVSLLGIILTLASPNITLASIGLFFAGVGADSASKINMVYMVQVFEANLRQKSMACISACFSVGGLISTLLYYLFEDWWTATLCSILLPAVVALILMIVFLQESPMFLVREGAATAQKALNKIGKINTGKTNCVTIQDIEKVIEYEQTEQFNTTALDLFRFKSLRKVTICAGIICVSTYLMYYGPILIVGQIGFDIYTSNIVLNASDLLVYYPLFLIIDKIRRKKTGAILLGFASSIAGVLIFISPPSDCQGNCSEIIIQLVLVFLFRYCISMQFTIILIYMNQLLPTRVRSIGCGMINVFGTMASTASPIIFGAMKRNEMNPFIVFAMMGMIGTGSYSFLRETFNQPIPDEIEEIEREKIERRVKQINASPQIMEKTQLQAIPDEIEEIGQEEKVKEKHMNTSSQLQGES